MRFHSSSTTAFRLALCLSVGTILVMGAAPEKTADEIGDFNDESFESESFQQSNHQDKHHEGQHHSSIGKSNHDSDGGVAAPVPANFFNQMTNSLQGMMGGAGIGGSNTKGSPLALGGPLAKAAQSAIGLGPVPVKTGHEGTKGTESTAIESLKSFTDLAKLIFNPLELVKQISVHFKLPLDKFVEKIGSSVVFGVEALLQPMVACIKIVEKVFLPDACRLKFVCKLTSNLHFIEDKLIKLSPSILDGSLHLKAFGEGIAGKDCDIIYSGCGDGPKLKKPFEELKELKEYKTEVKSTSARGLSPPANGAGDTLATNKQVATDTSTAAKNPL